jgi:hypothetical protein
MAMMTMFLTSATTTTQVLEGAVQGERRETIFFQTQTLKHVHAVIDADGEEGPSQSHSIYTHFP